MRSQRKLFAVAIAGLSGFAAQAAAPIHPAPPVAAPSAASAPLAAASPGAAESPGTANSPGTAESPGAAASSGTAVSPGAAGSPPLAPLAAWALAADGTEARAAAAELRQAGAAAVAALLAAQAADPAPEPRFREALDRVCAQRDCEASHLFWYTDLEQARAEARRSGRPILSLRLLGRLDEEMSCANSRFFRTVLYANQEVSRLLRDDFVLHWSSERPVPRVTIDFGDGRSLEGTITGNSVHYVLDARGRLVDALPGLYGPRAFLRLLAADRDEARRLAPSGDASFATQLGLFHRTQKAAIDARLDLDLMRTGGSRQAAEAERTPPAAGSTPTAYNAAPRAASKSLVETAPLSAFSIAGRQQVLQAIDWDRIAALHEADWRLDAASLAELERKQLARDPDPARLRATARGFERLVGIDTMRNEYLFHAVLHAWLSRGGGVPDLDDFNRRVYSDLFLTPRTDPWLGLDSPETFMDLEPAAAR